MPGLGGVIYLGTNNALIGKTQQPGSFIIVLKAIAWVIKLFLSLV